MQTTIATGQRDPRYQAREGDLMPLDVRRLRGVLAEHMVRHSQFADICGISRPLMSRILTGKYQPGGMAYLKIERGARRMGIDLAEIQMVRK